ncbi:pentapeptide repeat-containing protein [Sporolactobacillus shoreae]|uniref:Pentapeptide repeat-containing protein n=1 Tax=Sporolactobacillus shoreae TaxID=1465501 RepID=A0A4Z0GRX2_9BACL|nr:pentapeptide repeat-containing protein [Sporolactobacillus shoreae]TGA98965.1 pentapeptide repeat-containing protein [Sporolactobacillus shoreae]
MNEKLSHYLNDVFAPYDGVKSVADLKADLLSDLQERYRELKAEGKDDETAFQMTIDSIGDIEETVQEVADLSHSLERRAVIHFSASDLQGSDFAGVIAHKRNFKASALRGSDFSGADLTGSAFVGSDVREANFDGANLTDCKLSIIDLRDSSFRQSILIRTNISKSDLTGTKFIDVRFTDVTLSMTDLRKTVMENCVFNGVDFNYSDLRGMCFDGHTFIDATFDKVALNDASFKDATLKNVSFRATHVLTNKYYRAIKTICFDGAMMDKLTYAALKGMKADLSKVTVI